MYIDWDRFNSFATEVKSSISRKKCESVAQKKHAEVEWKEDSASWQMASFSLPWSGEETHIWQLLAEHSSYLLKIPSLLSS